MGIGLIHTSVAIGRIIKHAQKMKLKLKKANKFMINGDMLENLLKICSLPYQEW